MFDYNTTRKLLVISEYGRNIDKIVQYITNLPDRQERNKYAHYIIEIMGHLNPHLRDVCDFRHKLWDHLFIISEGKLDVDFPYGRPTKKDLQFFPQKLEYPKNKVAYRHYGNTIQLMIAKACKMPPSEQTKNFILSIANHLKNLYLQWNKEGITNEAILEDLKTLSKGIIDTQDINLCSYTSDLKTKQHKLNNKQTTTTFVGKNPANRHIKNKKKVRYNKNSK